MQKWLWKLLYILVLWVPIVSITFLIIPINAGNFKYIDLSLAVLGWFIFLSSGLAYYQFHPDVHDKERKTIDWQSKEAGKWNNSHKRSIKIALWFIWFFVLLTVASLMGYYFRSLLVFYFILSLWFVSLMVYLVHKKTTKK